jgi:hypothetical protein
VVTQALKTYSAAYPQFNGGYIWVTLLDPHPANNSLTSPWASFADTDKEIDVSATRWHKLFKTSAHFMRKQTMGFQDAVSDPPVYIPETVKRIEVWYQHTRANAPALRNDPDQSYIMNLWGLVDGRAVENHSNKQLSMVFIEGAAHNEIAVLYESQVVRLGHSKQ